MASERSTKCRICGELFTADVRNRKRQKYCPKRACRAAGKAQRQRRWLAQPRNRDYFRGPEHVQRVHSVRKSLILVVRETPELRLQAAELARIFASPLQACLNSCPLLDCDRPRWSSPILIGRAAT